MARPKKYSYNEITQAVESIIRLRMSRYEETGEQCYRDYAHGVFCLWDVFFGADASVADRDRLSALIDASYRSSCVRSDSSAECPQVDRRDEENHDYHMTLMDGDFFRPDVTLAVDPVIPFALEMSS